MKKAEDSINLLIHYLKVTDKEFLEYHNGMEISHDSIAKYIQKTLGDDKTETKIKEEESDDTMEQITSLTEETQNQETFVEVKNKKNKRKRKKKKKGMNFMMGMLSTGNDTSYASNESNESLEEEDAEEDSKEDSQKIEVNKDF